MARNEHELTRKQMKGPDSFQVVAGRAASWVAGHQKQIAFAVVALVGLVGVVVGFGAWRQSQAQKAGALLARVLDALEGEISSVSIPGLSRPVFASPAEQQRAVIAAAAEVRREYPSSDAARTAALASGDAHLRLGEYDAALADDEAYLRQAPRTDSLRFAALEGVARALEGKGELDGAARAFERLAAEDPLVKDRAALERARVLAKAGKAEEAKKVLAAFPEEFKDSTLKAEAQERLARLGGK